MSVASDTSTSSLVVAPIALILVLVAISALFSFFTSSMRPRRSSSDSEYLFYIVFVYLRFADGSEVIFSATLGTLLPICRAFISTWALFIPTSLAFVTPSCGRSGLGL